MDTLKSLGLDPSLLDEEDVKMLENAARELKLPDNPQNVNPNQLLADFRRLGVDIDKIIKKMRGNIGPKVSTRVKRNEQCPCKSGKKWKKCCGKTA